MIRHQKAEKSAKQYNVYGYINMLAKAYSYVWIDIHDICDSGSYGEGGRVRRGNGHLVFNGDSFSLGMKKLRR